MNDFDEIYKKVEKLADLMQEKGLRELDINEEDFSINLVRDIPKQHGGRGGSHRGHSHVDVSDSAVLAGGDESLSNVTNIYTDASIEVIESPMVGVFYEASSPEAEPFVKLGSSVKVGDTLCIIESMKLMNEITAEHDGTIEELCVSNEQVVDVGMPLFKIKVQ
jgi:acetyl-CoA carboxylase biotin carboxyl carrier protein